MSSTTAPASAAGSPKSRSRIVAFAALTALIVAAGVWKPRVDGIPLCAVRLGTGIACPGCGMTRALAALGRGEVDVSVRYHAFAPLVALAAILVWAGLAVGLVTGRDVVPSLNSRPFQIACFAFIGTFLLYWAFRLWQGTAP